MPESLPPYGLVARRCNEPSPRGARHYRGELPADWRLFNRICLELRARPPPRSTATTLMSSLCSILSRRCACEAPRRRNEFKKPLLPRELLRPLGLNRRSQRRKCVPLSRRNDRVAARSYLIVPQLMSVVGKTWMPSGQPGTGLIGCLTRLLLQKGDEGPACEPSSDYGHENQYGPADPAPWDTTGRGICFIELL